jgi:AcrR family transcriptional regulator
VADDVGVRADLLRRCVDHLGDEGLDGLRLRRLAEAVGTSHRMLLYYFGSREELLAAVVAEVEARQRRELANLGAAPGASFEEVSRAFWRRLVDPALHPSERLFFELYVAGLRGEAYARPFLDSVVDPWLAALVGVLEHQGVPPGRAPALARAALAAVRGLLLDLLGGGDAAAVDAAAEEVFAMLWAQVDSPRI